MVNIKKDDEINTESSSSSKIAEEDLTSESIISDGAWKMFAEKRRVALQATLEENVILHETCNRLESELNKQKQLLEEARALVETLKEMLEENENASSQPEQIEEVLADTEEVDHGEQRSSEMQREGHE